MQLAKQLSILFTLGAGSAFCNTALAQGAELKLQRDFESSIPGVNANLAGTPNQPFVLMAYLPDQPQLPFLVAGGVLSADGEAQVELSSTQLPAGVPLAFVGGVLEPGFGMDFGQPGYLGAAQFLCDRITFDVGTGGVPIVAGEVIAEQYADIGVHISALNMGPVGHPDLSVAFDSANVSGGDTDLATPGPGTDNDVAFGNVLIVAENALDANFDTYIDEPDDEAFGSLITFDFDSPVIACDLALIDVDSADGVGTVVNSYRNNFLIDSIPVAGLDDNNVQMLELPFERIDRLEVKFSGSGAVGELGLLPCPRIIDFDNTSTGLPLGFKAGQQILNDLVAFGFTVSATNGTPGHPDKVILFDSENRSGTDDDLLTPGTGTNNDVARGLVMIIAENDTDADMDMIVDDPDDEFGGGTMNFLFTRPTLLQSAAVLDIDQYEAGTQFRAYNSADALIGVFPVTPLGENSVSEVDFGNLFGVKRLELFLAGSGALADLKFCPIPELAAR